MPADPAATPTDRFAGFADVLASMDEVRAVMGAPKPQIVAKSIDRLSEICVAFIEAAPFLLVGSADGAGRCEVSPKGDPAGFVRVLDAHRLAIPERPGNRMAATFANILENPQVGLTFLVPGKLETLRVSGEARIVRDAGLRTAMAVDGHIPDFAMVVYVEKAEIHCPKCMVRSGLWQPDAWADASGLADIAVATWKHADTGESLEEMNEIAVRENFARLY